jgi:antitoxin VapB
LEDQWSATALSAKIASATAVKRLCAARSFNFLGCHTVLCYISAMINLTKETEDLAKRLAVMRHLSVDVAIRQALEESARAAGIAADLQGERDRSPEAVSARRARIDRLVAEIAALPVRDPRSQKEIADDLNTL